MNSEVFQAANFNTQASKQKTNSQEKIKIDDKINEANMIFEKYEPQNSPYIVNQQSLKIRQDGY